MLCQESNCLGDEGTLQSSWALLLKAGAAAGLLAQRAAPAKGPFGEGGFAGLLSSANGWEGAHAISCNSLQMQERGKSCLCFGAEQKLWLFQNKWHLHGCVCIALLAKEAQM